MREEGWRTVADGDDVMDRVLLELLLDDGAQLWSVDELARAVGDAVAAEDSLVRLSGAGLVHRLDGFVFASRAARRAVQLAG